MISVLSFGSFGSPPPSFKRWYLLWTPAKKVGLFLVYLDGCKMLVINCYPAIKHHHCFSPIIIQFLLINATVCLCLHAAVCAVWVYGQQHEQVCVGAAVGVGAAGQEEQERCVLVLLTSPHPAPRPLTPHSPLLTHHQQKPTSSCCSSTNNSHK